MQEIKCCYCGNTGDDLAYKTVFDQGWVFLCIKPVECLERINASIKKALTFTMEDSNAVR